MQSAVLRSHVVRPSVCPSVTLVDQDHLSWKSWKLIARTISATPSLFVPKERPPTPRGSWVNFGETRGGVGKNGVLEWSIKADMSLKRVKIEKKLLWGACRNSSSLFRTVPSRPPPRLGDRTPPKTPIAIISGTGKAINFKFGQNNNSVHPNNGP